MSHDPVELRILLAQGSFQLQRLKKTVDEAASILERLTGIQPRSSEEVIAQAAIVLGVGVTEVLDWQPAELLARLRALEAPPQSPAPPAEHREWNLQHAPKPPPTSCSPRPQRSGQRPLRTVS